MRRFLRTQRDEDKSQIQYLTAKCGRLAWENAVLERECLLTKQRERSLQNDLEVLAARLLHQEQINTELRDKRNQLVSQFHQKQELVDFLQQRVSLVAEESLRDATHLGTHLEQVSSELQCLQSSEVQLESLVEELHAEARHRATLIESLQAELHSKTVELEEQQNSNKTQAEELRELHDAYQRKVRELQQQDQGSLRKLQDTAEQFECLCHQQRHWMCCVKRFKDSLTEEKKALVQQVSTLEKRVAELRMSSRGSCPTKVRDTDRERFDRILPLWDTDAIAGLQSKMDKLGGQYEELFSQLMSVDKARRAVDGYQKPP